MNRKQRADIAVTNGTLTRRFFNARLACIAASSMVPAPLSAWSYAQQPSAPAAASMPAASIQVSPRTIAYLMADEALRSSSLETHTDETNGMVKRFWVQNWRDPQQSFEWTLGVEQAGQYEVTLMISAPVGSKIQVEGPAEKLTCETTFESGRGFSWDRITLPAPLTLPGGKSTVSIRLLQPVTTGRFGAALKSIELLNVVNVRR